MLVTSSIVCPLHTPRQPLVSLPLNDHLITVVLSFGVESSALQALIFHPCLTSSFSQAPDKCLNFVHIKVIFITLYECVTITL